VAAARASLIASALARPGIFGYSRSIMRPERDFQNAGRWPAQTRGRHPILVGLALVAVAAVAGALLAGSLDRLPGAGPIRPPPRAAAPAHDSTGPPRTRPDAAPAPRISPFRRSHPWAAPPGGRYYYSSSCPDVLDQPDLVFVRTEREARDAGYERSAIPRC
jgi:hypothetical protein